MEKLTIKIHDVSTGEIVEREMTKEEIAQREAEAAQQQALQEATEAARQAALAKLALIGLTPEDLTALGLAV
jgi:hypothetical protein